MSSVKAMDAPGPVVIVFAMEEECSPFVRAHALEVMAPSPFASGSAMVAYARRQRWHNFCLIESLF